MPSEEKPYRVYRGGRVKGKVPSLPRPTGKGGGERRRRFLRKGSRAGGRRRRLRWIPVALAVLLALVLAWGLASYFQFRDGVAAANKRLSEKAQQALSPASGHVSYTLLLGTDRAPFAGRETSERTDSITLVRVDTDRHHITYLAIPRDLRVETSAYSGKNNGAMPAGGPALAARTVASLTGLPVNHIVIVDFSQFEALIDKLGGVDIDVPERIVSKFDCPYPTEERCAGWPGWRFHKGKQHMDGHRALIYARVRKNELNPADTDFTRIDRSQQVLQAITGKLTSLWTVVRLPFIGGDLLSPIATDLSTGQLLSLGWSKFRASGRHTLHCRLGGEPVGGEIIPQEENRNVISMVTEDSAPQPPIPGSGPFGPGCVTGNRTLGVR